LDSYRAREQRILLDAIVKFLGVDAEVESKKRRQLRPNLLAPWELRIGGYRVFYEVRVGGVVRVLAVGHKRHNELFIRGQKVESIKEMKDGDRLLSLYNGAKLGVTITLPYQTGEKKKTVESKEFLFGSSLPVSD
jgi:mRNA-degrading endonuclease RelE of RelBE toxin-antitoxin system